MTNKVETLHEELLTLSATAAKIARKYMFDEFYFRRSTGDISRDGRFWSLEKLMKRSRTLIDHTKKGIQTEYFTVSFTPAYYEIINRMRNIIIEIETTIEVLIAAHSDDKKWKDAKEWRMIRVLKEHNRSLQ
jgi:hypothetical protein